MSAAPEPTRANARVAGAVALATVLLGLITWIDWVTGYEFGFFIFYFIPVSIAAWYGSRRWGLAFGVAGAICWYLSDRWSGHHYSRAWFIYWESFMRLVSFLTTALTLAQIRSSLRYERRLNRELAETLERVRQLEGLIPVCAWCRRVRDDAGYWARFEAYLASRTKATFTHGICPTCLDELEANPAMQPGTPR
jgi:hypothetical protein